MGGNRGRKAAPAPRQARRAFVLLATLGAGLLVWRALDGTLSRQASRRLFVVTADTLGTEPLGCYRASSGVTPRLDALARSGALFETATTTAPLTLPAHASIFTGTYPFSHGVRDNTGYVLSPDQLTLAEVLKPEGFETGGFVGAFVLDARSGIAQGFDRYFDDFILPKDRFVSADAAQRRADAVVDEALRWLETVKTGRFFAWVHLFDPHTPYDPPEPFRSANGTDRVGLYRGEVAFLDSQVGRLLDWLDREGLSDSTVVAFIGDHGESLGRHGELTHGFFVYDATVEVPLLLRVPGETLESRISAQVRSIDLMPTLLEFLGVAIPAAVKGRSLVRLALGEEPDPGLVAYSETYHPRNEYGWSELRSLRNGAYHFIAAPRPELYDLRNDPEEQRDVASTKTGVVRQFEAELRALAEGGAVEPAPVDAASRQALAALGYAGGVARRPARDGTGLEDPKDKIELAVLIKEAGADANEGKLDAALSKIRRAIATDPDVLVAYNVLGNVHSRKREPAEALRAFKSALARDPDYAPALYNAALACRDLKQPQAAEAMLERLLGVDPRDSAALLLLAELALEREGLDDAKRHYETVLALDPRSADAERGLGTIALTRGELAAAEGHFARAAELRPDMDGLAFDLGVTYHRLGNRERAEAAYRREIALHPESARASHFLGLLYAEANDVQGQLEAFRAVVRLHPGSAQGNLLLADALFQKGLIEEAFRHAERAARLDPADPQAHMLLAAIQARAGDRRAREPALARSKEPGR